MEKTYQFWTEVIGYKFLGAWDFMDSHHGKPFADNYTLSLYGISDGSAMAFFELQNGFQKTDDSIPKYTKHLALLVDSIEQLKEWQEHFKAHGLPVLGEIDHKGIWYSVYVTDPTGLTIELTYQAGPFDDNDITEGHKVLKRWHTSKNTLVAKV